MDLDVEIAKCDKKLTLAKLNLEKIKKLESQAEYAEIVPENVRLMNEEKVCLLPFITEFTNISHSLQRKTLEVEVAAFEVSKEMFAKLK